MVWLILILLVLLIAVLFIFSRGVGGHYSHSEYEEDSHNPFTGFMY